MSSAAASAAADDDDEHQRQPLPADPDWLSGVISRLIGRPQDAVTVIGDRTIATPAVSDPHNVLSSIMAVHIVYAVDGVPGTDSLDVVIKSLPQEPYSRAFVLEAQFDYREVHFYNTVGSFPSPNPVTNTLALSNSPRTSSLSTSVRLHVSMSITLIETLTPYMPRVNCTRKLRAHLWRALIECDVNVIEILYSSSISEDWHV